MRAFFIIALLLVAFRIVRALLRRLLNHAQTKGMDTSAKPLVESLVNYGLNILVLLLSLHILGINTAGIVAMVGAASLAIGLALKDMLANIASGLLLLTLRPFKAGDYIECGNIKGKILGIGFFNTILETLDGIYVSAPNGSLWGAPILNYSRNIKRRLDINVGIDYTASINDAISILKTLVAEEPRFLKDPEASIIVTELADNSVNICLRAWAKTENYVVLKSEFTARIKEQFEIAKISIPSRKEQFTSSTIQIEAKKAPNRESFLQPKFQSECPPAGRHSLFHRDPGTDNHP